MFLLTDNFEEVSSYKPYQIDTFSDFMDEIQDDWFSDNIVPTITITAPDTDCETSDNDHSYDTDENFGNDSEYYSACSEIEMQGRLEFRARYISYQ